MKSFYLFFICAVIALLFNAATLASEVETDEDEVDEKDVIVLTPENFDEVVNRESHILVEFYAPWCGHCKNLKPEYAAAATQLKEEGYTIKLAKVDVDFHKTLAERFQIRSFPTLKLFLSGTPQEYKGGRQQADIVNYLKKKTGPVFKELSSAAEVKDFIESESQVVVFAFFKNEDDKKEYISFAQNFDDLPFGLLTDASLVPDQYKADVKGHDSFILVRKTFDEGKASHTGPFDQQSVKKFILSAKQPLVNDFNPGTKIFESHIDLHFFLFLAKQDDSIIDGALKEVASQFRDRVLFTWIDVSNPLTARICEFFEVTEENSPEVRFYNKETLKKWVPSIDTVDSKIWTQFVEDVLSGKQLPHFKSEEPVEYSGKGVRVIVGKEHDQIVNDPTKNYFVEYYATWCGHCQKLEPIWEELATAYDSNDDIVIAKMESISNEVGSVEIRGFPMLHFYPAGPNKKKVVFEGNRELEELKKFVDSQVHQHTKDEL